MTDPLSSAEERIVELVREGRDELVALVAELVALDTTARFVGDPPRDEVRLQQTLATRLRAIGADVDIWEPEPTGRGNRFVRMTRLQGRPQLAARLTGSGGGRSLLLNGHIDAVTPGRLRTGRPIRSRSPCRWQALGSRRQRHEGRPGLAAVRPRDAAPRWVRLRGDVVYCANTDEESSGAGSLACVEHGVHADAGICGEPTGFDAWVCCVAP